MASPATPQTAAERNGRLWTKADIAWYASCSEITVEHYIAEADFPRPVDLPGRLVRTPRRGQATSPASR